MLSIAGVGRTKIQDIEIRCNELDQRCAVFGVALNPLSPTKMPALVIAARAPFSCGLCSVQTKVIQGETIQRIREAAASQKWVEAAISDIVGFEGRFTPGRNPELFVYLQGQRDGVWKSVVLNTSLSPLHVIGTNSYLEIIPVGTSDIDNNGLQEIWVHLQGTEGFSDGLIYFNGRQGKRAFSLIKTFLNGM